MYGFYKIMTKYARLVCLIALLAIVFFAAIPAAAFAAENPLEITVFQVFTTASDSADDTFLYRLKPSAASSPMPQGSTPDGYTFSIAGTDSLQIGPINFTQSGVFEYELFQVIATEQTGYTYDRHVFTIYAYVNAQLGVDLVIFNMDNTKTDTIEFRNIFSFQRSIIMVDPPVRKTVSGTPSVNSVFTFRLTAQNPANPMPAGSVNGVKTLSITGTGVGEFGTWNYDSEGVYFYTISEVNSGIAGYTYDTAVYTITDVVSVVGGQLTLSRIVTNQLNSPVTTCDYTNVFRGGGITTGGNTTSGGNTSGGGSVSRSQQSPWTGDNFNTLLWILTLAGSAAICMILLARLAKRRAPKNK